jgi:hypothetical protein
VTVSGVVVGAPAVSGRDWTKGGGSVTQRPEVRGLPWEPTGSIAFTGRQEAVAHRAAAADAAVCTEVGDPGNLERYPRPVK